MKTVIDNNQRVFQIVDSYNRSYFCNLFDIERVMTELGLIEDYFKVYHFWNSKPQRASKKLINDMLEANGKSKIF